MFQDPVFLVAANLSVAVLVRILKPNLATAGLLALVLIVSTGYLGARHGQEVVDAAYRARDAALTMTGSPPTWPPEKNRTYPDLELTDQEGNVTRLSDFRGQVLLIEPVGIPCQACVAFSGEHRYGAFTETPPQADLKSIAEYALEYGGVHLDDPRFVHVQIILFNQEMKAPSAEDVRAWAEHFHLDRSKNQIVLAGSPRMVTKASRNLIPGFQLVDKDFVLRANSTGLTPQDDLYTELLPLMRKLRDE